MAWKPTLYKFNSLKFSHIFYTSHSYIRKWSMLGWEEYGFVCNRFLKILKHMLLNQVDQYYLSNWLYSYIFPVWLLYKLCKKQIFIIKIKYVCSSKFSPHILYSILIFMHIFEYFPFWYLWVFIILRIAKLS